MKLVKGAWKLLIGVKDGLVLLFMLLFFGVLFAALSYSPNPSKAKGGALLLALQGAIVEQPEAPDVRAIITGQVPAAGEIRLRDVVHALETAAKDDAIKTVVLDLSGFAGGGQVALSNVGVALDKVKAAKKPVLAFSTIYSDDSYQLAAHASEIWLDPMGGALFAGPGGSQLYFKGLIDRVGANVHIYRVGKYKSFVEPFTRSDQSPEAKASDQVLVDALWGNWQREVAKARPKANLAALIGDPAAAVAANGKSLSKTALATGIVDTLGDSTAFAKRVAKIAGSDDGKDGNIFKRTSLGDYVAANPRPTSGTPIGIITVAGGIVGGEAGAGSAGGETISKLIRKELAKNEIKAIVVRVESGGGSALASEQIRSALLEAKAKGLPVIASMGNVAASGGYWVAMAGDKVFAERSTITGSIGVFGILPTFENTIAKYGVTTDGVQSTPLSGQPDLFGGTNAVTDSLFQAGVEDVYTRFLTLVSSVRKMPIEKVNEVAQGRVWDGSTALEIGLIDAFGSVDDAIAEAAKRAKIKPENVARRYIEEEPNFLAGLLGGLGNAQIQVGAPHDMFAHMAQRQQQALFGQLAEAKTILATPSVQARCLECPVTPRGTAPTDFLTRLYQKVFS